jgi:DNA-directed RNA polymerase specialized sigma24 family protein
MGRSKIEIQVNLPNETYTQTITIRDKLRGWRRKDIRRRQIIAAIKDREDNIRRWRAQLDDAPIKAWAPTGMPRGTDVGDPTGEFVVKTMEKIYRAQIEIAELQQELDEINVEIRDIERAIEDLNPKHRQILTLYYRDGVPWESICSITKYSKSEMYRKIENASEALDRVLLR